MRDPTTLGTLPNLEAFCRTFETGSFSRAAERLGVTPQATSRAVARLETSLGVTLFRRTTRSLAATEAARFYYNACRGALELLAEGGRQLSHQRSSPTGVVRLSIPTSYGHHRLMPALARFRDRYPGVEVELHVSNHNVSFVRDGHDLAIRMGRLDDQSFTARKLGEFPLGVFCSPEYVARNGTPMRPADLDTHSCVAFVVLPRTGRVQPWSFSPEPTAYLPKATYRVGDDVLALLTLARAGVGLVQTFEFVVAHDIARGALVEVLGAHRGTSRPFSLIYPRGVTQSRATRAMIDFIIELERPRRAT